MKYYSDVHFTALENTDFIFKLEDFCFDTENSIRKLLEFLEIEDNVEKYTNIIKVPPSIGRGKDYYDIITDPII